MVIVLLNYLSIEKGNCDTVALQNESTARIISMVPCLPLGAHISSPDNNLLIAWKYFSFHATVLSLATSLLCFFASCYKISLIYILMIMRKKTFIMIVKVVYQQFIVKVFLIDFTVSKSHGTLRPPRIEWEKHPKMYKLLKWEMINLLCFFLAS